MAKPGAEPLRGDELHRLVEETLQPKQGDTPDVDAAREPERHAHELQVRQLEMQNEELRRVRDQLEANSRATPSSTTSRRWATLPWTTKATFWRSTSSERRCLDESALGS
jgi:hypothetical protein